MERQTDRPTDRQTDIVTYRAAAAAKNTEYQEHLLQVLGNIMG